MKFKDAQNTHKDNSEAFYNNTTKFYEELQKENIRLKKQNYIKAKKINKLKEELEESEKKINTYGNNGASFVKIEIVDSNKHEEMIHLKVGDCCVYTVDHYIPTVLLADILSSFDFENCKVGFSEKYSKWIKRNIKEEKDMRNRIIFLNMDDY